MNPEQPPIELEAPPRIRVTDSGNTTEEGAAAWLSYRMQTPVSVRLLRSWRTKKVGPAYSKAKYGRSVWYRIEDLEAWLEACYVDPLAS